MPRKSSENFKDMTLRQLKAYSDTNPKEGKRIAIECKEIAKYASKQYLNCKKAEIMDIIYPQFKLPETK